jgi:serine/threonine-protein kinase
MKLYRIDDHGVVTSVPDEDRLVTPWGVIVEPTGAILVVDRVSNRLWRLEAGAGVSDVAEVKAPRAILFDKQGNTLVLTDQNLIKIVEGGKTEPLLADPPFEFPQDAVLHPDGNYYVTDGYKRAIWQLTPRGQINVLAEGEPLLSPQGITVDKDGNLLVADPHAQAVFKVTTSGEVSVLAR